MQRFFSLDGLKRTRRNPVCFLFFAVVISLLLVCAPVFAAEQGAVAEKNTIIGMNAVRAEENLEITIFCGNPATYKSYRLSTSKNKKLIVDINDAEIKNQDEFNRSNLSKFDIDVTGSAIPDALSKLIRIQFTLPRMYPFTTKVEDNNIVITLKEFYKDGEQVTPQEEGNDTPESEAAPASQPVAKAAKAPAPDNTEPVKAVSDQADSKKTSQQEFIDMPAINPLNTVADSGGGSGATGSATQDRTFDPDSNGLISVDFYKIDLHNVFRMLREISGKNIVVAEGVSGNLTLALTDVPWEFALDIILNLKDLSKIDRENTLVIYPKDKEFIWPEKEDESLSIEVDERITGGNITIKQEQHIPPAMLEAKKLIARGRMAEKKGNLENAVQLYEKALTRWPKNAKLANKISAIYLAKLNQNAKAVYFAKKALAANKKNSGAALNAAIGHANMKENRQAQRYFDQSINTGKPSREALISYAAFSERQKQYNAALRLLGKLNELYGQDLNSMVAQARILDAQGNHAAARKIYKSLLYAGFRIPPDLKNFIMNKIKYN